MVRKYFIYNRLRSAYGSAARRAFSLAELVVSMAILVLMLLLAGQVFNFTIQSTGQAMALTEVAQQLRMFEETLRDDLRTVQPGQSLILIQGNPVNAYWTKNGKEGDDLVDRDPATGYDHVSDPEREDAQKNLIPPRADILMIFTARRATSYVSPAVQSNLEQVVYGHAEPAEIDLAGKVHPSWPPPATERVFPAETIRGMEYPSPTEVSPVPAEQWHLARRSVLLLQTAAQPPQLNLPLSSASFERILRGEADVVGSFEYEGIVLQPSGEWPWYLPEFLNDPTNPPYARSRLDPAPPATYANRLGHYFLPNCASFKVEWSLNPRSEFVDGRLNGSNDVFWFDPGAVDPLAALDGETKRLKNGRSACDSKDRSCMNLESLLTDRSYDGSYNPATGFPFFYSLHDRFRGAGFPGADADYAWDQLAPDKKRPNLVVFTATRPGPPGGEPVPDALFPGALRITIDLFDKERRLERPTRHVIVVPVGG